MPVQNRDYWTKKIARNKDRHQAAHMALAALGWEVTVLWECEIRCTDESQVPSIVMTAGRRVQLGARRGRSGDSMRGGMVLDAR